MPDRLNSVQDDPCCADRLRKAIAEGHSEDFWLCPVCETQWNAHLVNGVMYHWEPQSGVVVW